MTRIIVLLTLLAMFTVPAAVAAQYTYPDDETMTSGSPGGGDINVGGQTGGQINVGGGGYPGGDIQIGGGDRGGTGDVAIVDFAYDPAATIVAPGTTVSWYNAGDTAHTVDSNSGLFESGAINPGGSYSTTFDESGVYAYHCDFHPQMIGMVVVTGG